MIFFIRTVASISARDNAQANVIPPSIPTTVTTQTAAPTTVIEVKKTPALKDVNAPISNEELAQPGDDSAYLKDDAEAEGNATP
jgi:hypothetical protein